MKKFLTIVLRNQFNLFYRFGYTFIPKAGLIDFDGKFTDACKEAIVNQFATVTPFDYDEEYLILYLEKVIGENDSFVQFEIQDVLAVYPLSQQAKTSIESKIDERIRLEEPILEMELTRIEAKIDKKDTEKAISALWAICKIESSLEKYLSEIKLESIFNGLEHRRNATKANKIDRGNFWEYLIAYDRFDYFPNSTLGYFYDAGQVFAFSKGLQTFEGSTLHKCLEQVNAVNPTIKLPEIIKSLEADERLQGYITQTTTATNMKQYIIAPLYLMLRDELRKLDNITQTKLFRNTDYLKKLDDSFNCAVVLLGAFFGFRKFYDLYYESLNLRFYKTFAKTHVEQLTSDLKVDEGSEGSVDSKNVDTPPSDKRTEEAKVQEATGDVDYVGSGKQKEQTDILSQYRVIIEEAVAEHFELKLTDLSVLIKERTGQKFTITDIKGLIKQLDGIEIVPKRKPEVARRKDTTTTLFNDKK